MWPLSRSSTDSLQFTRPPTDSIFFNSPDPLILSPTHRYSELTDELTDRLIEILAASRIKQQDKLRFDFALAKSNLEMERVGYSITRNKLIVLPTHFAIKSEQDFTTDFTEKLQAAYLRLAKLDLSKLKEMFIISPEELRFAILCEITKANWDYIVIDTSAIGLFAYFSMNLIYYIKRLRRMGAGKQYTLASLIWIVTMAFYFYYREALLDAYVDFSLKDAFDLDLVEGGLHYLNKQIQLNRLLGKDASHLEKRLAKFKVLYEELKVAEQKLSESVKHLEEEESDEDESDEEDSDEDEEDDEERPAKTGVKSKEQVKREEVREIKSRLKPDIKKAFI